MKKIKKLLTAAAGIVLMFALAGTAFAESPSEESRYVYYEDGLLDDNAYAVLNGQAAAVSEEYDSGVYMVMVDNYRDWDGDLDRAAQYIYEELGMGMRNDQDGIMLLLSMEDRDYILLVHGVFANQAYNEYARDELADAFLDEFGENDFQAGFEDYIEECGHLLSLAADGTPLTRESNPYYNL